MEPLKFEPLLKHKFWGGDKIIKFKGLPAQKESVGESWEVSGVAGSESIISYGPYKGETLSKVLSEKQHELVGKENYRMYGDEFPLLVKFIDASHDLSIQVHPDDETAIRNGMRHGKTEMWYIIDAEPDARLFCGLKEKITLKQYKEVAQSEAICNIIKQHTVKENDCFFIPSGCIHGIGKGCFLAEIQQASDVTYRIYDFRRKDENDSYRELHIKEAQECVDFGLDDDCRVDYVPVMNQGVSLIRCPYFNTVVYDIDSPMTLDYSYLDSFVIFIGIKGEGEFLDNEGNETSLKAGEAMLVPATTKTLKVSGRLKFLETTI